MNNDIWVGFKWHNFGKEVELGLFEIKQTDKTVKIKSYMIF